MVKRVMDRMPPVKSVMTPFPHWIEASDPLGAARNMLAKHSIRYLPVMDQGQLIGVFSDSDLQQVEESGTGELRVRDVPLTTAFIVDRLEPLDRVLRRMAAEHLDPALVVLSGKLVGIFTMTDACRPFGEFLRSISPDDGGDDAA